MAESYKKAIQIPITTGLTGTFVGFQNGITAQSVTISGAFIYNSSKVSGGNGFSFGVPAGAIVPVNCTSIIPSNYPVIGFIA